MTFRMLVDTIGTDKRLPQELTSSKSPLSTRH